MTQTAQITLGQALFYVGAAYLLGVWLGYVLGMVWGAK